MSTAAHAIDDTAELLNPNVVKVVCDAQDRALLFSRAPLPWWRDGYARGLHPDTPLGSPAPLRHVGLYAYRAGFLRRFPALPPSPIEALESLEQLRVLWHGERIAVHGRPAVDRDAQARGDAVDRGGAQRSVRASGLPRGPRPAALAGVGRCDGGARLTPDARARPARRPGRRTTPAFDVYRPLTDN